MIRNMLITTATIALMTSGALAAESGTTASDEAMKTHAGIAFMPDSDMFAVSEMLGTSVFAGEGSETERIGEVSNVVLNRDGMVEAIVVDVGGFLGIGEKPVALDFRQARWTQDDDGNRYLTVAVARIALEDAQAFDPDSLRDEHAETGSEPKAYEQAAADMNADENLDADTTASVEQRMEPTGQETAEGVTNVERTDPSAVDQEQLAEQEQPSLRDSLTIADQAELRAEDLIGATVFGANDENIGEVGDIILSDNEEIEAYIIEVGGFLGIGEKPVAIDAAELNIMADESGSLYIFTPFTEEQLDGQPAYDESANETDRDANILRR